MAHAIGAPSLPPLPLPISGHQHHRTKKDEMGIFKILKCLYSRHLAILDPLSAFPKVSIWRGSIFIRKYYISNSPLPIEIVQYIYDNKMSNKEQRRKKIFVSLSFYPKGWNPMGIPINIASVRRPDSTIFRSNSINKKTLYQSP